MRTKGLVGALISFRVRIVVRVRVKVKVKPRTLTQTDIYLHHCRDCGDAGLRV